MKNIKRISAFISAILITANCCYPGKIAEAVIEEVNSTENNTAGIISWEKLSDLNNVMIPDKTYNGNNEAAVDFTPLGIGSAEEYRIPGVAEGDDVQLTAEAFFDTPDAGDNKNVTVRFGLKGADADKYQTDSSNYEISMTASIKKAVVKLIPDPSFNYIFCGADVPIAIPFTMTGDMSSETERLALSLSPDCTGSENTGAYSYSIINNGTENANIDLIADGSFYVVARPEIISEPSVDDEITGCIVNVNAPKDTNGTPLYLVGKTADDMGESVKVYVSEDSSIEFLIEQNNGSKELSSVKYELKRNEYDVLADSSSIKAADGSSLSYVTLKNQKTGEDENLLVTNKALKISVKVSGNEVMKNNNAVLKNGEDKYEASSAETEFDNATGKYTYIYSFDIDDVEDSEEKNYSFDLELTDEANNTISKKIYFRNDASQAETCNIVVDKKKPKKGNIVISYFNSPFRYRKNDQDKDTAGFFIVDGNVTDSGSGIAKIEYQWDEDIKKSDFLEYGNGSVNYDQDGRQMFESVGCNEYYKEKIFAPYIRERKTPFQILVPYSESLPLDSRWYHKLTLKLTDNAGNTRKISANAYLNENTVMDSKPPVVTKVKMSSENGVVKLPSGNYSNSDITFKISAEDEGDGDDCSGITKYALLYSMNSSPEKFIGVNSGWEHRYGYIASEESDEEKVRLVLSEKNKLFSDAFISVFDENLSGKYSLKEAIGTESDDVLIDTVNPHVTSDISQARITHDSTQRYVWFREGQIVINADDTYQRGDASGIRSIVLQEDDSEEKTVKDNSKESERKAEDSYSVDISTLDEGMHTYRFYAVDNAGNESDKNEITFGIDNGAPSCSIEAVDPVYNENWFRENDDFEINIDLSDSISGIDRQSVSITVNGVKISFDEDHISKGKNGLIYTLSKKEHLKNVPLDGSQCYHIEVSACDYAGNELAADAVKTFDVHIDRYAPWINELTVSKIDMSDPEKKINVSKHGIFANTGIKLTVSAFDSSAENRELPAPRYNRNESQIKSVYITFDDGTQKELEPVINGSNPHISEFFFTIPLPKKGKSYKKRFSLTVCDNTGRKCSTDYIIRTLSNGTDVGQSFELRGEKNIDLVIEEKAPSVAYTLPEAMYEEKITDNGSEEKKRFWFSEEAPAEIVYTVRDEDSGLRSVVIKENGNVLSADDSDKKQKILTAEMSENAEKIDCTEHEYRFVVSADHGINNISGVHRYEITAEDNAGNRSVPVEYEYYIDNKKPKITGAGLPSAGGDEEREIPADSFSQEAGDVLNYSIFYKDAFTAKIYVDDEKASSGLKELSYKLITNDTAEDKAVIRTEKILSDNNGRKYAPVSIPDGFKGRISAEVCDNVNNRSGYCTLSSAIISESEKPDIDIAVAESSRRCSDGNALFTEDASVKVVISDLKSGLKSWRVNISSESDGNAGQNVITQVTDGEYKVGDVIGNGWLIDQMDANLITAVSKTFVFDSDDNNISIDIEAEDNCGNTDSKTSESFTVDKTPPVIDVKVSEGLNGTDYYNADKKADIYISVTERNFDSSLINADISNSYGTNVPVISFSDDPDNKSLHTAVLHFGEGDFTFDIKGEDLAGHNAVVNKSFYGIKKLFVDETAPVVTTNFDSFGRPGEQLYYSEGKRASISILEHNFDPSLTGIRVYRKASGSAHDLNGFNDETYSYVGYSDWKKDPSNSDRYTLEFDTDTDSVYKLEIAPYDKAGNGFVCAAGSRRDTEIYEIDTTAPEVINKNGARVSGEKNEFELLDIYTPERGEAEAPTVEFDDINFDHLSCMIKKFVPKYNDRNELGTIEMEEYSEDITDKVFTLDGFDDDGIYSAEIFAYDKAGNRSLLNRNTYVKMMNRSILAYIPNSDIEAKSGLFSFEYADGTPVSKRPDDFSDINITLMSTSSSEKKIVLRDMNGDETDTELYPDSVNTELYGITICNYTLKADFFKNNYQNDTDKELILTVKDNGERMDLGRIHIDNIKPEATIPSDLKSWKWYPGKDERTIVLTDISEVLDAENCRIYDNDEELPFDYSDENKTLSFSIDEGWHNIGIHLVDTAGNAFDMQEAENICVGNFWSWVIGGAAAAAASAAGLMMLKKRKRRRNHPNF